MASAGTLGSRAVAFDVPAVDVGVALAAALVDQVWVEVVHTQHVAAPHLVERMRKINERNENR